MNYNEIENLKSVFMHLVKKGCRLKNEKLSIDGRIIGIGFKPYWTNPSDTKIDKLEFNYQNNSGKIEPLYLHNVIGYDVVSHDGGEHENIRNITVDLHVYSEAKNRESEPFEKVRISLLS